MAVAPEADPHHTETSTEETERRAIHLPGQEVSEETEDRREEAHPATAEAPAAERATEEVEADTTQRTVIRLKTDEHILSYE